MFHITNGDSANLYLKRIGIQGCFIAWQDCLHEGRLIAASLEQSTEQRAAVLADRFNLPIKMVRDKFAKRNALLETISEADEVILWLTPELFDCLIALQAVAWLQERFERYHHVKVILLPDHLPPRELTSEQVGHYFASRFTPQSGFFELAQTVWLAITSQQRAQVEHCLALDFTYWPQLKPALKRYLEEQPDQDGLTRTMWQVIDSLADNSLSLAQLFGANQQLEENPFMGDLSFWCVLEDMRHLLNITTEQSLLHQEIEFYHAHQVSLNEQGHALLRGY